MTPLAKPGHNGGPALDTPFVRPMALYLATDKDGNRDLSWTPPGTRPPPVRDHAFERAFARKNREITSANKARLEK